MSSPIYLATVSAPTNIAVIKYWGKANVALNTPLNDSLSLTLDQQDLRAVTTVASSYMFTSNRLWLNGTEITTPNARFDTVVEQMKQLAQDSPEGVTAADWKAMKVHVSSYNTFPTAAGLASSAAGYAALVAALAQLYHAKEDDDGQFSVIARQGSGSACRSLYGGFVAWRKGTNDDYNLLNVTSRAEPTRTSTIFGCGHSRPFCLFLKRRTWPCGSLSGQLC
jgi:diphosphomevalonate decarboxylase